MNERRWRVATNATPPGSYYDYTVILYIDEIEHERMSCTSQMASVSEAMFTRKGKELTGETIY